MVEESSVFGAAIVTMNVNLDSNTVKAGKKRDVLFADESDNDEAIIVKNEDNWLKSRHFVMNQGCSQKKILR